MKNLLVMSLAGGTAGALILILKPFTKRFLGYTWQFYIWLVPLLAFVVPIRFNIPVKLAAESVIGRISPGLSKAADAVDVSSYGGRLGIMTVWSFVLGIVLIVRVVSYILFVTKLRRYSWRDYRINSPFRVFRSPNVKTPVMTGFFRTILFIPEALGGKALEYTLRHETIHFARKDVRYKWIAVIIQSIHWFNPLSYIILKHIDEDCEVSCDYAVSGHMNRDEKREYMSIILGMASEKRLLTANMVDSKSVIIKRFAAISAGRKKHRSFLSVFMATIICVFAVAVSGFAAGVRRVPVVADKNKICVKPVSAKPECEPMYEEEPACYTEPELYETEAVYNYMPDFSDEAEQIEEIQTDFYDEPSCYFPGDMLVYENSSTPTGVELDYNTDDRESKLLTVNAGEDGVISVNFKCDYPETSADICIDGLAGYNVPANPDYRYDICGLEPGKEYTVAINTYCPGNYNINGTIIIGE